MLAPVWATSIDSGNIVAFPPNHPRGWDVNVASSAGGYAVSLNLQDEFSELMSFSCGQCGHFSAGTIVQAIGFPPDETIGTGSATLNGVTYPSLVFATASGAIQTVFYLRSDPFTITGRGVYTVPFTMTGFMEAAIPPFNPVGPPGSVNTIINDEVTTFFMMGGGGTPDFFAGYTMDWTFSTPEPGTLSLAGGALATMFLGFKKACLNHSLRTEIAFGGTLRELTIPRRLRFTASNRPITGLPHSVSYYASNPMAMGGAARSLRRLNARRQGSPLVKRGYNRLTD